MALETGTYISDLVVTNPTSSDPKSQGDDHLRLLKSTVKTTFPNITGAVTPTHTELNYVDGVTSAIQTQLDAKAPLASPALTGTPTAPTATAGDNTTKIATTAFVVATSLNTNLPGQTGNSGKLITTDGSSASWTAIIDNAVVTPSTGTAFATTTGTQSFSNKTYTTPIWQDSSDNTKKANVILSGITAGQNRNITVEDKNILLKTPGWVYLSTVTASSSATVDLETTIDSTYDMYAIVISGMKPQATSPSIYVRVKVAGAYKSGASDYVYVTNGLTDVNTVTSDYAGQAQIPIITAVYNTSDRYLSGIVYINSPSDTTVKKHITWDVSTFQDIATDKFLKSTGVGAYITDSGAITGMRFLCSSQNIVSGNFTLFGIRKA